MTLIECDSEEVIIGYDVNSWKQQTVYLVAGSIYVLTDLFMIYHFIHFGIIKKRLQKKSYLITLYVCICLLFIFKFLFYLGSKLIIDYGIVIYRLLGFLPTLLQNVCFLIYCLGLCSLERISEVRY